jgi:hypothetical protein
MGWLDFFKRKESKTDSHPDSGDDELQSYLEKFARNDFLGKAAVAGHNAKQAVGENRHDEAWRLYHEQKTYYLQHANRCGFTARQTLALDGSVSEDLANILRLEQKHDAALTHMLYCLMSSNSPTKSQQTKIVAYFNRCKFIGIGLEELNGFINSTADLPDLRAIQSKVKEWRTRS